MESLAAGPMNNDIAAAGDAGERPPQSNECDKYTSSDSGESVQSGAEHQEPSSAKSCPSRKCDKSKSVKLKPTSSNPEGGNNKHHLLKRISSAPTAVMSSIFSQKTGDPEPNFVKRASLKLKKRYSERKVLREEEDAEADERMKELSEADVEYLATHTAVGKEELKRQFSHFLEKHPNGCITRKDFSSIMRTCFPERDFDILEKRIFHMYDKNGDGKISFVELMTVMYIMSSGTPEDNLKQIFRIFDADGNGEVTRKEMKKLVKDICALLCDEDSVKRSKSDMKQMTAEAMKEMDTNCDGKIDEEEFVRAIMSHEKVASMLTLKIVEVFDPDNFA